MTPNKPTRRGAPAGAGGRDATPAPRARPHAGPERREASRTRLRFTLPYRHPDLPEELLTGTVRDITAAGLSFAAPRRVEVGDRLTLFLDHLPGSRRAEPLGAQVVRTEIDEHTGDFVVGARFLGLTEELRSEIALALDRTDIMALLRRVGAAGASDLHLAADHPPLMRLDRELRPLGVEALPAQDVRDMILTLLDDHHRQALERDLELDFSLSVPPRWRYRVNVHYQRGNLEAAFRQVSPQLRSIADLDLPQVVQEFADLRNGLVVITGPAGSGKTTAAAAMIEHINASRAAVIITVERPIEYLYACRSSVVKQREIGLDTRSCAAALRESMRQDPDVILIGEVRDEETMQSAVEAAQTGHLVIATFPAASCVHAILRLLQLLRRGGRDDAGSQIASCLRGIVALRLLPRRDLPGLVPATEVLVSTPAVANMIRQGATAQIRLAIQSGRALGMHTFEASLERLRRSGLIAADTYDAVRASL